MRKFNRVISLLLCVVMVCCMLPVAPASAAEYPQRTAPSELKWGVDYWKNENGQLDQVALPGSVSWVANEHSFYAVAIYKEGQSEPIYENDNHWGDTGERMSDNALFQMGIDSGRYYFTVTSQGNGYSASDSETVVSSVWNYTKPTAQCAAPTNLRWNWPNVKYSPAAMLDGKTGNWIAFYYAENAKDTPKLIDLQGFVANYTVEEYQVPEELVQTYGKGYYYFQVETISTDIEKKLNSDWSEMSDAYYYDGNPFVDVSMSEYYGEPVLWAVENGITNGLDDTHFGPNATCTRGQIVTFLWRANGSPEPKSGNNPFYDVTANDYFYKAVLWAVENGITSGMSANSFAPNDPCTRGQVATFLWRAEGKPGAKAANSFSDVASGAYYYNAVLWAVANGVTNGMGNGTFAPDAPCTRGQIVTFLYRAMA